MHEFVEEIIEIDSGSRLYLEFINANLTVADKLLFRFVIGMNPGRGIDIDDTGVYSSNTFYVN